MAWRRPQSHSRQLRQKADTASGHEDPVGTGSPAWYARRALQRAAVFDSHDQAAWARRPASAASVAAGVIVEVREEAIVLDGQRGTEWYAISPATVTWLGARTTPSALRSGDPVIIRHAAPGAGARAPRLAESGGRC